MIDVRRGAPYYNTCRGLHRFRQVCRFYSLAPRQVRCDSSLNLRPISPGEMPPRAFCAERERSISAMNCGSVLSFTVSRSAFSGDGGTDGGLPRVRLHSLFTPGCSRCLIGFGL